MVYVAACQNYELYFNGQTVGKGLAYSYPQYGYYNGYDVTALIKSNTTIAAMTHWYGGGQGRPKGENRLILKLIVTYLDGKKAVFGTDKSWKQTAVEAFNPKTKQRNGEGVGGLAVSHSAGSSSR